MIWALAILAILVLGSLVFANTQGSKRRALEISNAKGALPRHKSDRDLAYVVEFHRRFGPREFSLGSIEGKTMSRSVVDRFGVRSARLDDRTVIGKRLPEQGLLILVSDGRYRLSDVGVALAISHEQNE